jgi:hypothetical protein
VNIRKLIREELEKMMDAKTSEEVFDRDISYISGFSLLKKESKSDSDIWIFEHRTKDYSIRFYLRKNKKDKEWTGKIFIYWKVQSSDFTNAKGKDFEYTFGPYKSYKEMVSELNRKLHNNPLFSSGNYFDDNRTQLNNDVLVMIQRLIEKKEKLNQVKDKKFNDLKKLYNKIYKLSSDEEINNFLKSEYPDEADKQTLLLTLQKMFQLDFYLHKEELEALF